MDEESDAEHEESGWKMVYADVFRPPETAVYLFTSTIVWPIAVASTV